MASQIKQTLRASSNTKTTLERESPIQVLTKLNVAWLHWSYESWYFQVDKPLLRRILIKELLLFFPFSPTFLVPATRGVVQIDPRLQDGRRGLHPEAGHYWELTQCLAQLPKCKEACILCISVIVGVFFGKKWGSKWVWFIYVSIWEACENLIWRGFFGT